ncbi:hypothetical protein BO85DRAFT_278472 [Aspergillus piperis CBS 112811]|uniref:Uncharacterized protein n=1 Tax=Aspergillus piperis CBS 112811 TaxID=1448313 RepID=A0A8G1R302_9EURO|nr:hypothetical protein BO85DRAFT_278472 [Aspergillus piperis CBS 112811]RAH58633.1 hypothetical protein BO85DRAFT_278472 [Aspergillus piperis CBS 112811]
MQSFQLISPHPANGIVAPVGCSSVILIRSLGARMRLCRNPSTACKTWLNSGLAVKGNQPSEGLVHRPLRSCTGPCRHGNGRPGRCDLGTRGTGSQMTVHRIGAANCADHETRQQLGVVARRLVGSVSLQHPGPINLIQFSSPSPGSDGWVWWIALPSFHCMLFR